tara:strand:+ start:5327 stop:6142 length:816 start_codon:yes stop_codon:yes gene_type:complete
MQLSINELTTYRWTFDQDVRAYRKHGVQCMSVWQDKVSDYGEEKGAELLAETDMDVATLMWAGGFTGDDGRSFQEAVEDAERSIELAALLQAKSLTVYSGARGGHTRNHARRLFMMAIEQLLPTARTHGIELAVEVMHPNAAGGWTFLTELEMVLDLVQRLRDPMLKMAIDLYHWGQEPHMYPLISDLVQHLSVVHIGDTYQPPTDEHERCLLGNGIIPLELITQRLIESGFEGPMDVKLLGQEIELTDYDEVIRSSIDFTRGLFDRVAQS